MNTAGTDENLLTLVPVLEHGARVLSLELAPVPGHGARVLSLELAPVLEHGARVLSLELVPVPGHCAQISAPAPTKGYVQTGASARALVLKITTQLLCDHSLDLFWNVITTTTTTNFM